MKIRIIGCSGSGKSYLAKKLSQKHNLPHFDLDDLQWDNTQNSYGVKMPVEKRDQMLSDILIKNNWIIEGVYYGWVQKSFEDADIIYVLDVSKRLYITRIIRRFIRRKIGKEKGKKETFKSLFNLLKWTNTFQNKNMEEIKEILSPYNSKTIYLKSKYEINKVLNH